MKITRDDAYRILGVNEDSSPDEIRSSYKKLALKWHPDKHGDSNVSKDEATLRFQEVSAAYKRLTTSANDGDDEIDDNEFMNIREMMELFAHIFFHNGVRGGCPHHGMDCCDYDDDDYFYSDDDYYDYTDDESEDEFLDSIAHRLRNKFEQRKYKPKDKSQTQRHSITEEEALRNARELIEEEELEKKREEKKKAKRKKKKEKKKQKEKEKKEQEVITNNCKPDELSNSQNSNKENSKPQYNKNIASEEKPPNNAPPTATPSSTNKQTDNNTNGKKSKGNDASSNKKNNSSPAAPTTPTTSLSNKQSNKTDNDNTNNNNKKDNSSNKKNNKNTEIEYDEDSIDTNSAFFAHAASKAPVQNGIPSTDPKENNTKKKKNNSQLQQQTTNNSNTTNTTNNKKSRKSPNTSQSIVSTNIIQQPPEKNGSIKNNSSTTSTNISHKNTDTKQPPMTNGTVHRSGDIILQSRQVAVQGNQLAQQGDHSGAVDMFSKAIKLDPSDFRFFGNRSYCYDRLEQYEKALSDADAAINLAPEWPKGHFRKGRALTGLKRFQEAEQVFQQVLKLDPVCEDAQFELARVRVQILMDMGFTRSMSEQAVRTYSTVQQALEALLAGKVSDEEGSDEVYISDEEQEEQEQDKQPVYSTVTNNNKKSTNKTVQRQPQPKCTALWVGNVDPQLVTEKQMSQLFSKCGKVSSVRILPHKYCAFVNYVEPSSASAAMEKLQGAGLGSQKLLLRFPNNPPPGSFVPEPLTVDIKQNTPAIVPQRPKTSPSISESSNDSNKASGPVNGNECYFWRTTGCVFENQCRYRHVRGHKGVDLPKVQAKYGKIPTS